jgi:alpha-methylacyl-CoA racemase
VLRKVFEEVFRSRTRADWEKIFAERDACATPVLSLSEAFDHPHNVARGTFETVGNARLPAPAPRLSRTPAPVHAVEMEATVDEVREGWGNARKAVRS